jgi:exopolysaccharide biosynthesis protein
MLAVLAIPIAGTAQDTLDLFPSKPGSLLCWSEGRTSPRPLQIHYIRIDLTCKELEVTTFAGADPDGDGPAESSLTPPADLFQAKKSLVAVNANAFAGLPGTENDIRGWYRNRPVDIHGLAVRDGRLISPVEKGRIALWMDTRGNPHIGDPNSADSVQTGVSDWSGPLLAGGKILANPAVKTLHPRSAAGFDDTGRWLLLVVVDGRQSGYSEGVSLFELAQIFQAAGCTQAINMDGGGSSIMLIRNSAGEVKIVNRPSGLTTRPVPVMLGIRLRD